MYNVLHLFAWFRLSKLSQYNVKDNYNVNYLTSQLVYYYSGRIIQIYFVIKTMFYLMKVSLILAHVILFTYTKSSDWREK